MFVDMSEFFQGVLVSLHMRMFDPNDPELRECIKSLPMMPCLDPGLVMVQRNYLTLSKVSFRCQLDCFSSLEDILPSIHKAYLVLNLLGDRA